MRILLINSLFFLTFISFAQKKEIKHENSLTFEEEHEVISSLLDSIYDLDLCHEYLTFTKPVDSLYLSKLRKRHFISKEERDNIKKFATIQPDSLVLLNIGNNKDYILKKLNKSTNEYSFILSLDLKLNSKKINQELIKQKGTKFYLLTHANKKGMKPLYFGKRDSILNVGSMKFSRVIYSNEYNTGIFHYTYLGDPMCGFTSYIIFSKEKSKWVFKKAIHTGVF